MNKDKLISLIAQKAGLKKNVSEAALNAFMDAVKETLGNNQKITLVGFGTFEIRERKERKGMNPRTKEQIIIPATKLPVFKAGKDLKAVVTGIANEDATKSQAVKENHKDSKTKKSKAPKK